MTLVDVNLLIYATDEQSPFHRRADRWLSERLVGSEPVGLPWPVLAGFVRLVTNFRAAAAPLSPDEAWGRVEDWLEAEPTWIPTETHRHAEVLGGLVRRHQLRGNDIPGARLAALAIEHGLTVCSNDTGFARFGDLRWHNPLIQA